MVKNVGINISQQIKDWDKKILKRNSATTPYEFKVIL